MRRSPRASSSWIVTNPDPAKPSKGVRGHATGSIGRFSRRASLPLSTIDANLKLPADARRLPDTPNPDDPVYVVTRPRVALSQGRKVAAVSSIAAAEALAESKGRRIAVTEFTLGEASSGPDRGPEVDLIVSSGTIVPQPRAKSARPQWKYVSHGFDAYHVYRKSDGRIVFQLRARVAD